MKACLLGGTTAIVVGFLAITSQSLWIDEANSAVKAMAADLPSFFAAMRNERGSDVQMPLYMLLLWGWEKIFGHSEFSLRAMNIPMFTLALVIAAGFWRTTAINRIFFVVFACSSAFVWAYLDEARPYILQFLGATACAIPLVNTTESAKESGKTDVVLFATGALLLCASSLLGVVFSFWFAAAFFLLWFNSAPLANSMRRYDAHIVIVAIIPALLVLAAYYAWTLFIGARASSVGETSAQSVIYAAYELLGMAGLGPGRGELRVFPSAILPFVPMLGIYIFALGIIITSGAFRATRRTKSELALKLWVIFWAAPAAAALTTLLVGVFGDFRIVGRHLMPLLPFLLIFLSVAATSLWQAQTCIASRATVSLVVVAMMTSALAYRVGKRHAKDDYRSSAALAREALSEGKTVWWAADPASALFYGLNLCDEWSPTYTPNTKKRCAHLTRNLNNSDLSLLPKPDMVIVSKADIYDNRGNLKRFLVQHSYQLQARLTAFNIFTPSTSQPRLLHQY